MTDRDILHRIETLARSLASRAARPGVPGVMAFAALSGVLSFAAIATSRFLLGAALLIASRAASVAVVALQDSRAVGLSAFLEFAVLASMPFAFALAEPQSALASSLLLFAMTVAGAASLFAVGDRHLRATDAMVCTAAFVLACVRPDWFGLIAYGLATASFVAAGARAAFSLSRSGL